MAWDDAPPKPEELKAAKSSWDGTPPTPEELGQPSFGQKALGFLGKVGSAIDSYTGAPMRAAIGAAQNSDQPTDIPGDFIKAGWKQFGEDPSQAPTGEDIVKRAGVPDRSVAKIPSPFLGQDPVEVNPAKIAGSAMEMAANPLNFVGLGAKAVGKGAEALSAVSPKVSGAIDALKPASVAESLQSFAHEKAIKAAGAMTKDFRMIQDKGMQDALGSFLLDNKIVTPLATVSKVADRLEEAKAAAGKTIGHILDTSDAANAPRLSARDIALELSQDPEITALATVPGKEGTAEQIGNYLETLYKNGDNLTLREAQKLRQGIDDSINFNKRVPEMAGGQPYLYKMRDAISQKMNEAVNALPGGGEVDRLKEANSAYSKLATLDRIAENRIGALSSNRTVSLTDTMAGLAAASIGHSPMEHAGMAAAGALANKAGRTFGAPMMATGANKLAGAIKAAPDLVPSLPQGLLPAGGAASELVKDTQGLLPARAVAGEKKKK